MKFDDVIGLVLVLLVVVGALLGLAQLAKPQHLSEEEYARRLEQSSGIAGNVMNALHKAVHPDAERAAIVQQELRAGRYNRQSESEGGTHESEAEQEEDRAG